MFLKLWRTRYLFYRKLWSGWWINLRGSDLEEGITYFQFIIPGLLNLFANSWRMQFGCYQIWTPQGTGEYLICKWICILEAYYSLKLQIFYLLLLLLLFSTFRYKPGQVFLEKDLILPYVPNVDLCDARCASESYSKRSSLLFFRGRLKRNAVRILVLQWVVFRLFC
jgi:hypothetical protein